MARDELRRSTVCCCQRTITGSGNYLFVLSICLSPLSTILSFLKPENMKILGIILLFFVSTIQASSRSELLGGINTPGASTRAGIEYAEVRTYTSSIEPTPILKRADRGGACTAHALYTEKSFNNFVLVAGDDTLGLWNNKSIQITVCVIISDKEAYVFTHEWQKVTLNPSGGSIESFGPSFASGSVQGARLSRTDPNVIYFTDFTTGTFQKFNVKTGKFDILFNNLRRPMGFTYDPRNPNIVRIATKDGVVVADLTSNSIIKTRSLSENSRSRPTAIACVYIGEDNIGNDICISTWLTGNIDDQVKCYDWGTKQELLSCPPIIATSVSEVNGDTIRIGTRFFKFSDYQYGLRREANITIHQPSDNGTIVPNPHIVFENETLEISSEDQERRNVTSDDKVSEKRPEINPPISPNNSTAENCDENSKGGKKDEGQGELKAVGGAIGGAIVATVVGAICWSCGRRYERRLQHGESSTDFRTSYSEMNDFSPKTSSGSSLLTSDVESQELRAANEDQNS